MYYNVQDKFLPFIDLFQRETVKVEVCKTILSSFIRYDHYYIVLFIILLL